MAKDDIVGDIEGANNALSKMTRLVKSLVTDFGKLGKGINQAVQPVGNGGTGQRGLGVGSGNRLSQSMGGFSFMPPTGNVEATWNWTKKMNLGMGLAQGGLKAATGIVAGGFMAMPDVETTMARASGFYGANLLQGGSAGGRAGIAKATFGAMRGGISGLGMDAATAGILSGMGVSTNATGVNAGQFTNLAKSTANAAKYLNIDNATAAQALGGLTQGGTSSALMRNFGIYTTDPTTGKRLGSTEIFAQLNQRMTGGQKLSVEDLKTSMQGGALAENLRLSGLDPTQQRLAYQYMLDAAGGKQMDLSDDKLMARLQKDAGINPDQAVYDATSSQTKTMETATDAYIEGMKKAAVVIEQFNGAMQGFLKTPAGQAMAQLNAGTNLAMKDPVIGGGLTAGAGILSGLGSIGGALLTNSLLTKSLRGAGVLGPKGGTGVVAAGNGKYRDPKTGRYTKAPATSVRGGGGLRGIKGFGLGAVAGLVGMFAGDAIAGDSAVGSTQSKIGSAVSYGAQGAGLGAMIGSIVPGIGTGIGAAIGGIGGAIYGGFAGDGGGNPLGAGSNSGGAGDGAAFKLIHPVGKARMVCGYGVYDDLHPNGHWAVDWSAAEGTGIMAAADGKVTETGGTARNTMGTSDRSYGLRVKVDHGNGYSTLYAHVSGFDVTVGQMVKQGQQIARVGNTGFSEAPHLHFELWKGGTRVDPSPFLGTNYAKNSGVVGGGSSTASNSARGMGGSTDAGLLGFSAGTAGNGTKIPSSYKGAAVGKPAAVGGGRTSASSGGGGTLLGKGTSTGANLGGGMGTTGGGDGPGGGGNNVTINVTVAQASESEARRFAKLIQEYLEVDSLTSRMGRL
jgi:murein DD-endopeptidase MepM/ murein hydrolase activator NlpD